MDGFDLVLGKISVVLELIGSLLVFSSFIGNERIERWEGEIHSTLNIRKTVLESSKFVTIISNKIDLPVTVIFSMPLGFVLMGAIVFAIIELKLVIDSHLYGSAIMRELAQYADRVSVTRLGETVVNLLISLTNFLYVLSLFLIVMIVCYVPLAYLYSRIIERLSSLLLIVFISPVMVAYVAVVILLVPYYLAERAAIRFNLQRPVFAILGSILLVIGVLLQIPEQFGLF